MKTLIQSLMYLILDVISCLPVWSEGAWRLEIAWIGVIVRYETAHNLDIPDHR